MKLASFQGRGIVKEISDIKELEKSRYIEIVLQCEDQILKFRITERETTPHRFQLIRKYFSKGGEIVLDDEFEFRFSILHNVNVGMYLQIYEIFNLKRNWVKKTWKQEINEQLFEATKQRAINKELTKLVKLLLTSDSEFKMIYSSSREQYIDITFPNGIGSKTAKLLLLNGYKNFYLNHK